MTPWFGLHLPNYTFPGTPPEQLFERIVEQAQTAERAGFSLVTVMDHLYQIGGVGPVDDPMLEGWSVLNALARETTLVRLGTLVSGVTYRNPAMLAKMATTLDVRTSPRGHPNAPPRRFSLISTQDLQASPSTTRRTGRPSRLPPSASCYA